MHYLDEQKAGFIEFARQFLGGEALTAEDGFFAEREGQRVFVVVRYSISTGSNFRATDLQRTVGYAAQFSNGAPIVVVTNAPVDPVTKEAALQHWSVVVMDQPVLKHLASKKGFDTLIDLDRFVRNQW